MDFPSNPSDEHLEMDEMLRQHEGLRHQFRMEHLISLLGAGTITVAHSAHARSGNRIRLWLDNGEMVELRLFWPCRTSIVALTAIGWDDRIGWVVSLRGADGDDLVVYAWKALVRYVE